MKAKRFCCGNMCTIHCDMSKVLYRKGSTDMKYANSFFQSYIYARNRLVPQKALIWCWFKLIFFKYLLAIHLEVRSSHAWQSVDRVTAGGHGLSSFFP